MLTIKNLVVDYGKGPVIQGVDLQLEKGKVHGIIGLNGSGKTTLLRTISGEKKASEGQVFWEGEATGRKSVAFLPTESFFYSKITGGEYLSLYQKKQPGFNFQALNELFHLPLRQLVEGYSTGMKKKLALMAIISLDKPLLLLDEPFNGLDLESNIHLKNIILHLKETGRTLVVTSHILESLTGSCDQIHYLSKGKIIKRFAKEDFGEIEQEVASALHLRSAENLKGMFGKK